jgi:hypothetical protein
MKLNEGRWKEVKVSCYIFVECVTIDRQEKKSRTLILSDKILDTRVPKSPSGPKLVQSRESYDRSGRPGSEPNAASRQRRLALTLVNSRERATQP